MSRSKSSGGSRGESEAAREAREAEQRQEALDNYIKGLETELRLLKLTAVEREKEQAILDATRLIQNDRIKGEEQLSAEVKQQIADRAELLFLEREQQEETKRRAEEDARALEDQRQKVQEFEKEVVGELAASIADIWEGGEGGIDRTLDYWRKRIIAWLSEMAAKLILQPIIAPIIQSVTGGLGLGDAAGGIGANFGSSGVGGVSSLGASLGSLGKSIDQLGRDLGLQLGGATGPFEANTGLFGTTTFLSDVAGGALGGIGIGSTVASLTGGNSLGGSIGGLVGGALGSFLGPLGSMLGGAVGGFLGGLLGPKPTNATARIDFDEGYNRTQVPFSKETAETRAAINNAADQIVGVVKGLESVGTTFTDRLTAIAIGVRDESYIQFESGALLRSAVGDPNALALTAIKELLRGARFESQSLATVAGRDFGSLEELTSALDFVRNTYDAIAEAKPAMTGAEQAMKDLTDGLKAARKEAERLGLSVEKLDAGARTLFDRDISDQIRAITDPVGLAMEQAERDARARLDVAKQLGADLVQVERLNALQREQVLAQAAQQNFAGLRSLIDDISFGGLSAAAPSEQYFSALTRYNDAKRLATELGTPEALADYESSARAVLPIARSFLGTSQRYGELQNDVLATARTLSTPKPVDPALIGNAIIEATQASYAIVDEVKGLRGDNRDMQELLKRFTAQITAFLDRKAA